MTTFPLFLLAWLVQAVVAAVVVTPVVFIARKRVHWHPWESLSLIIPFCTWGVLVYVNGKSLGNVIIEPGALGLMLGIGAAARVAMSRRMPEDRAGLVGLFSLWAVAAVIFCAVPGLEE